MDYEGYIYLLINPSLKGMVGVATTDQDPEEEAAALSKAVRLSTPFIVVYQKLVCDCERAKAFMREHLAWYKAETRKIKDIEFFIISINCHALTEVIDGVVEYCKEEEEEYKNRLSGESEYQDSDDDDDDDDNHYNDNYDDNEEEDEETPLYEMEENLGYYYRYGENGYIQDPGEAMYHYKLAIKYGSISAYSAIGMMYYYGEGVRKNRNTALRYLNDGVRKGNYKCYSDMMDIYFLEGEYENAIKAFRLAMQLCTEFDKVSVCCSCINLHLTINLQITQDIINIMKPYAPKILEFAKGVYELYPDNEIFQKRIQFVESVLL